MSEQTIFTCDGNKCLEQQQAPAPTWFRIHINKEDLGHILVTRWGAKHTPNWDQKHACGVGCLTKIISSLL